MMTLSEAREIGASKLKVGPDLFTKCLEVAKKMSVRPKDLGPMTLALAIMGLAKATNSDEIEGELTDALAMVSKAEREWRLDRGAIH